MNRMVGPLPLISLFNIQINIRTNVKLIRNTNEKSQTPFRAELNLRFLIFPTQIFFF